MKILKKLVLVIGALMIVFVVLAFFGPKDYKVERKAVIKGDVNTVWSMLTDFEKWHSWTAWAEMDHSAQYKIEGPAATVGSVYSWVGDKDKVGTGSVTTTEVVPMSKFWYQMAFKVPFEMQSEGGFTLVAKDAMSTEVTWVDQGHVPFLFRPMLMFKSLDKELGPQFDRGLFKLDSIAQLIKPEPVMVDSTMVSENADVHAKP